MGEQEVWKDIPGTEGAYQASSLGRVRSCDRYVRVVAHGTEAQRLVHGRILRPARVKSGHLSVVLGRKHGSILVHEAVAYAFLGPRPQGLDVCHNDGNPENNAVDNLRYDTRTNNNLDVLRLGGVWRKLTLAQMLDIQERLRNGAQGVKLAREYGVSQSTISRIKVGRCKACRLLARDTT